jgi:ketose-bisphosphate aldolase
MNNSLKDWLDKAKQEGFAIGAFNAANLEVVKAIIAAGQETKSPIIIEASPGEIGYFGFENFLAVVGNFRRQTGLPIFTNLDHGKEIESVEKAIGAGFDLVHFDGSDLPFEENLKTSAQLAALAHQKGVLIEVEFEKIEGSSEKHQEKTAEEAQIKGEFTDPEKAVRAVAQTGADLLAVSIGNLHGVYQTPEEIDLLRLEELTQRLPCFFSLHGGSGIQSDQLEKAIKLGVAKINVNTDLRLAYRETLDNVLRGSEEIKIYKLMPPVIAAVQKVVEEKIELFGSGGRAGEGRS